MFTITSDRPTFAVTKSLMGCLTFVTHNFIRKLCHFLFFEKKKPIAKWI